MSSSQRSTFLRNQVKRKRPPQIAWLIHRKAVGLEHLHWIVLARTIEDAWQLAWDLPGAVDSAPQLGAVIDEYGWSDFARKPLVRVCEICNPPGIFMQSMEARTWASWLDHQPATVKVGAT